MRFIYARAMRRKLARFDEPAALELVVTAIARALEHKPSELPVTLHFIRSYVATRVGAPKPALVEMGLIWGKLAKGLRWTAIYEGRDETRRVRYFRIVRYRGRQRIGEVFAELDTTDFEDRVGVTKILRERLTPIAESGIGNTTYRGRWRPPPSPPAPDPAPKIASPTPRMRELQRLLERVSRSGNAELNHEMWERYGASHASPEERTKMDRLVAEATEAGNVARVELTARVERARAEAPAEFAAWVDAHDAYYAGYAGDDYAHIAAEQRARWADVRAGKLAFVEPPLAHLATDTERYRQLYGIDPVSLRDI